MMASSSRSTLATLLLASFLLVACTVADDAAKKKPAADVAPGEVKVDEDVKKPSSGPLEKFEGDGTFGVEQTLCDGEGEFSGEAEYKGDGTFMSEKGSFEGTGTFFVNGGTFRASSETEKWTCEGSGTFTFPSDKSQAKFSGNGTIYGDGEFNTPAGSFKGLGTYEGNSVVFTSKAAALANLTIGTLATEEVKEQDAAPAKASAIRILGSGIGSFVGVGEFQGEGTCKGAGTVGGSATLKGKGSLVGSGTFEGKGTMDGSGTFTGKGTCEGVSVRYYESDGDSEGSR